MATLEHKHLDEINKLTLSLHHLRRADKIKNFSILISRARSIIKDEEKKKFVIGPHDVFLLVTLLFVICYHFIDINEFYCKIFIDLKLDLLSKCSSKQLILTILMKE